MIKQIWEGNESHDRGEKNKTGKNRKHKIIGESCRHLERVMTHQITVRAREGPLHAPKVHRPTLVLSLMPGKYLKAFRAATHETMVTISMFSFLFSR